MENALCESVLTWRSVLQIHAVDVAGRVIAGSRNCAGRFIEWCVQLPAGCVVAMEASTSAHHWCRKLRTMGLNPKIIAAHLVAPYRMQGASGKNDPNDAAAPVKRHPDYTSVLLCDSGQDGGATGRSQRASS